jgi:hypothetical protein
MAPGPGFSRAIPKALLPDYIHVQFAGSQGLISAGAGKSFLNGLIEPDLDYGYVPDWAGGVGIHVLSQTTTFAPLPFALGERGRIAPVLGYSAQIGLGEHYFLHGEKNTGYYWPSALHFRFFGGAEYARATASIPGLTGWAGTVQIGAIDAYWQAAFYNDSVGFGDILTAALAVNLYF